MAPNGTPPSELWRGCQRWRNGIWQSRIQHSTGVGAGTGLTGTSIGATAGLAGTAGIWKGPALLQSYQKFLIFQSKKSMLELNICTTIPLVT